MDSEKFHLFQSFIARLLKLPVTSRKVISEFVDADVNADAIAQIIHRNQYYENLLLQEIKAMGMKENTPSIRAAIALFGMTKTRDFICAVQIYRMITRQHPEVSADGKIQLKPNEMVGYARKTEDFVNARNMKCGDTAYAGGVVFDILQQISLEIFEEPKGFKEYTAEIYKHGLKSAMIGNEIAKTIKGFSYAKYVFSACLVHDVGKLALELLHAPDDKKPYVKFRDDLGKKPVSRENRYFAEGKRFGLSHDYLGSMMIHQFELFRAFEKAILCHHSPYLLKSQNKDLYQLACVIALASNVAGTFRIPKDDKDPLFNTWFPPELSDFKIDRKILTTIVNKVAKEAF